MTRTMSLLNMKGGVGKTTLAVNLAWYLHEKEPCNILLIDLDPQFNTTQYMMDYNDFVTHSRDNGTIADILIDQPSMKLTSKGKRKKIHPNQRLIRIHTHAQGYCFDLLPAELRLGFVVKNPAQMEYKLEKVLESLRNNYDYILIDCAPTDSVLTTIAMMASDYVMVPVRPDRFAILGFANFLETLGYFRDNCQDPHRVQELGVVFTQVTGNSQVETECMSEITTRAIREKSYVFTSKLRYSNTFIRAVKDQTPAYRTKYARGKLLSDIASITKEMKQRITYIEGNK
ncbi:MAG: ParA family protein [bacterium]